MNDMLEDSLESVTMRKIRAVFLIFAGSGMVEVVQLLAALLLFAVAGSTMPRTSRRLEEAC